MTLTLKCMQLADGRAFANPFFVNASSPNAISMIDSVEFYRSEIDFTLKSATINQPSDA
jgi:hypothetical protein